VVVLIEEETGDENSGAFEMKKWARVHVGLRID
jgi:hypothetical protein